MKMEQTECSETSAYNIQMLGIAQKKTYKIQNTAKVEIKKLTYKYFEVGVRKYSWPSNFLQRLSTTTTNSSQKRKYWKRDLNVGAADC